jgi:phosphoglucomutase
VTDAIESFIGCSDECDPATGDGGSGELQEFDFVSMYLEQLARIVSWETIRRNPLRVVYDPFYGTGRGILDEELRRKGASAVRTIHDRRDPLFGNRRPEPCEEELQELARHVVRSGASLGVSTDGDADRFGIVDENGVYVAPHDYLPLLLDYLVTERGWSQGIVVRSLSTGSLLDRVARSHGLEVEETRVGFKYLGELMIEGDVILAGEESGGLSVLGHVPEKDGIAACLLAAEMVSRRGMGIGAQLREHLWPRYGRLAHLRKDVELTDDIRSALSNRFLENTPDSIAGLEVVSVDRRDGAKFHLEREDNWFLVRLSGTEPLARLFFQSDSREGLDALSEGVLSLLPRAD